jgi:SAM-dependent methyltransferase
MTLPHLELGSGSKPTPGYLHHDLWKHSPYIDLAFDLRVYPWPLDDSSVIDLLATDVFEHTGFEIQPWLDECHRILAPGGSLSMRLPAWDYHLSYRDPTHYRVFHPQTFDYWCPGIPSRLHEDFGRYYFGPTYDKWWEMVMVTREVGDLRFILRKPPR